MLLLRGWSGVTEGQERLRYLETRVRFLEERIRSLRTSRRILMNLLALQERERRVAEDDLSRRNSRLQARNRRYAQALMERHIALHRLSREREYPVG